MKERKKEKNVYSFLLLKEKKEGNRLLRRKKRRGKITVSFIIKRERNYEERKNYMNELIASMPEILVCLLVCCCKIIEISIQSLKTVMMVKGERLKAAGLGFVECVIWGLVISSVISTLGDNLFLLFFYCLGYAAGLFIGSTLENKIALETSNIQLIANEADTEKIKTYLKENNRGFTVFDRQGSKEKMNMILIVTPRKDVKSILSDIRNLCDNRVFEITSEVSKFTGGYGIKK